MGLRLQLMNFGLRVIAKPYLSIVSDPIKVRRVFARMTRLGLRTAPNTSVLFDILGPEDFGVPIKWIQSARPKPSGVVLYFHGGGYIAGSLRTHRALASTMAALSGLRFCLPDYRLAPEHPFPAALDDAATAYRALLARGYQAQDIVLGGDSAGGGLALGLLQKILAEGMPKPAALFAFSPWTDLSLESPSLISNNTAEPLLPVSRITELCEMYLDGAENTDAGASPLFGDYRSGPPVMIQVGSKEILLDDSLRMTEVLKNQGVDATVEVWKNAPHVWHMFHDHLSEARQALDGAMEFVASNISRSN